MTLEEFVFSIQIGEEIELFINEHAYFLQPDDTRSSASWDKDTPPYPYTVVYEVDTTNQENVKEIFRGTTEEVLSFPFANEFTLKNDFELFVYVF